MGGLACGSITGCDASPDLLEALSYGHDELAERLPAPCATSVASSVVVRSTRRRMSITAAAPSTRSCGQAGGRSPASNGWSGAAAR
jgi:hypothetical protein